MTAATELAPLRLALGIAPEDALRRDGPIVPIRIDVETGAPHVPGRLDARRPRPAQARPDRLARHPTGRHSLHYFPGICETVTLRLTAPGRLYVPRRLQVPLVTLGEVREREAEELPNYLGGRVRRPVLFPGAAYPVGAATGARGLVKREDGSPARWAHLQLREEGTPGRVVAHARADDRGEFVLVLPPRAVLDSELSEPILMELAVWAHAAPPEPPDEKVAAFDPDWDQPLEIVSGVGPSDAVSAGTRPPGDFVESSATRTIEFGLGQMRTARTVGVVTFRPP